MKRWESIIRNNYKHLDSNTIESIIVIFEISLEQGYIVGTDKEYVLKYCDNFCRNADLPPRESVKSHKHSLVQPQFTITQKEA